ncbi:hypothetical protein [Serinicoccus kebangsaanensis]|uniref:hypothetical protein n=1 Tax=Serinicoccus kebangsaanensis TaxID=2602069 RepID=UPI00124C3317|nr:hypothetical protein [Serinicoccus kebangsaanensis]
MEASAWTLVLGIIVGVAANAIYQFVRDLVVRLADTMDIKGVWGERILDGEERIYSIGEIRYDVRRSMWILDGTNFYNDGRPFCHWRTVAARLDRSAKKYYYVFDNTHENAAHAGYTGFGVVNLSREGRKWTPSRGAFAAGNPGECFRSHTMVRLARAPLTREARSEAFKLIEDAYQEKSSE